MAVAGIGLYFTINKDGSEAPENIENAGGKYNATISLWEGYGELEYTDEDGTHSETYFMVEMRNGLDWIRTNIPETSTFLCWWDYGHMIKGYAERNVIVRNPSIETVECVCDPSSITEFDPHERVLDVATAFTTSSSNEMLQIMQKYNANYIVVTSDDLIKTPWMFRIAELDETEYVVFQESITLFTEAGEETMIARLLENRDIEFALIFEDKEIKVYKIN